MDVLLCVCFHWLICMYPARFLTYTLKISHPNDNNSRDHIKQHWIKYQVIPKMISYNNNKIMRPVITRDTAHFRWKFHFIFEKCDITFLPRMYFHFVDGNEENFSFVVLGYAAFFVHSPILFSTACDCSLACEWNGQANSSERNK